MQNTDKNNSSGFVAGTLVHTDKGLIPIQNLQVGDLVTSIAEQGESCFYELKKVVKTFKADEESICQLTIRLNEFNNIEEQDFTDEVILSYRVSSNFSSKKTL